MTTAPPRRPGRTPRPAAVRTAARPAPAGPRYDRAAYDQQHPEAPELGYLLYRIWGRLPTDDLTGWQAAARWLWEVLLGPQYVLLYIGISSRAGIVRWLEHLATQWWARRILRLEVDETVWFPTLADAEAYEAVRIRAECPRYNKQHNDPVLNRRAANGRVRRTMPTHRAMWRRRAGMLALSWLALTPLCAWVLTPDSPGAGDVAGAVVAGMGMASALLHLGQIVALAVRGADRPRSRRRRRR